MHRQRMNKVNPDHLFMFHEACANGDERTAKEMYESIIKQKPCMFNPHLCTCVGTHLSYECLDYDFINACCYGHLSIAQWLLTVQPDLDISAEDDHAFSMACTNGHLHVVQWLLVLNVSKMNDLSNIDEIDCFSNFIKKINELPPEIVCFREACKMGDVVGAKEWYEAMKKQKPDIFNPFYKELKIDFIGACEYGCLPIAQWLLEINPSIDISHNHEEAFRSACTEGHLHIAQWLLSVKPDIDISTNGEKSFIHTCMWGQLHIAQWLLSVKPDINISADEEMAFRSACRYGHLAVAQWLLLVKPELDVSAEEECAFKQACYYDHLDIAQWLLSVKPDMDVSIVDKSRVSNEEILALLEEHDLPKFKGAVKR